MEGRSRIGLRFQGNELYADFRCSFAGAADTFRFSINALLEIDGITDGTTNLKWHKVREWQPMFRARSQEIEVTCPEGFAGVSIRYHGRVDGWCNIIEDRRRALSYYSCWHPQEASVPIPEAVISMEGLRDYIVLNGAFDTESGVWTYGGQGYDQCNIIALRKGDCKVIRSGDFSFYYLDEAEAIAAENAARYFNDTLEYYCNCLYWPKPVGRMNLVSLNMPDSGGAYIRKELIVMASVFNEHSPVEKLRVNMAALMSHELAHNWCAGADTVSWHDWMNETTAEWSSLLYALERNDTELFDHVMGWKLTHAGEYPPIKTDDGSRPRFGVHEMGTLLFYGIYKRYGKETVTKMVRAFVNLDEKTTERYLAALRASVGDEIAGLVERGLCLKTFDCLFAG